MKKIILTVALAMAPIHGDAMAHPPQQPPTDVSFAFGGARTDAGNATAFFAPDLAAAASAAGLELLGLDQQLQYAEETIGVVRPRDVFYLSIGTNDFLSNVTLLGYLAWAQAPVGPPPPVDPYIELVDGVPTPTAVQSSVERTMAAIEDLYLEKGARHIVVPNLAPIGMLPLLGAFGLPPETLAEFSEASSLFNTLLAEQVGAFEDEHGPANIVIVDVEAIVDDIVAAGELDTTTPCNQIPPEVAPPTCEGFLFVDLVHPTTGVFRKYARAAKRELRHSRFGNGGRNARRIITLGDSLADTGSFDDVILRSTGVAGNPAAQRYWLGRFSDGPNAVDYLEVGPRNDTDAGQWLEDNDQQFRGLNVRFPSVYFEQPPVP